MLVQCDSLRNQTVPMFCKHYVIHLFRLCSAQILLFFMNNLHEMLNLSLPTFMAYQLAYSLVHVPTSFHINNEVVSNILQLVYCVMQHGLLHANKFRCQWTELVGGYITSCLNLHRFWQILARVLSGYSIGSWTFLIPFIYTN